MGGVVAGLAASLLKESEFFYFLLKGTQEDTLKQSVLSDGPEIFVATTSLIKNTANTILFQSCRHKKNIEYIFSIHCMFCCFSSTDCV